MARTIAKTVIAAVLIVLCVALLLPGTVKAQDPIGCWQEGAMNGPQTCVCTGGAWMWLQSYGQGFCPWTEAGKTGGAPGIQQLPTAVPIEPTPLPLPMSQEDGQVIPTQEYYNPNFLPNEIIHPNNSQEQEEILVFLSGIILFLILLAIVSVGFYKTITK